MEKDQEFHSISKIPKPMIKIEKKPLLVHIMDIYQNYGFNEFIIAAGYKSKVIQDFFLDIKNLKILKLFRLAKVL